MKAVILAGGFATRLWPLTKNRAKPLLEVKGKPIIDYVLEKIEPIEEVDTVYISINEKFEEDFERWKQGIEKKTEKNLELVVEPTTKEKEKLGSIGAIRYLIKEKKIEEDLLVAAGDNLFDFSLKGMVNFYRKKNGPVVGLYDIGDREKVRNRYGVCILDEKQRVTGFQEKPEQPKSTLISTGIYLYPERTLKRIKEYLSSGENPDAPGFFIQWLHRKEDVFGYVFRGDWFDIGTKESLERAREDWQS